MFCGNTARGLAFVAVAVLFAACGGSGSKQTAETPVANGAPTTSSAAKPQGTPKASAPHTASGTAGTVTGLAVENANCSLSKSNLVRFDRVLSETGQLWSPSQAGWVAPTTGVYAISADVTVTTGTLGQINTIIALVNGNTSTTLASAAKTDPQSPQTLTGSKTLSLNAGDLVQLEYQCTSGNDVTIGNRVFSISELQ